MSPDFGRFLQPDPIGFKGDASNLYRFCGNDWANRTDPMGLEGGVTAMVSDLARWAAKIGRETAHQIAHDKAMQVAISRNPGGGIAYGKLQANINLLQSLGQQLGASMTIAHFSAHRSGNGAPTPDAASIHTGLTNLSAAERDSDDTKFMGFNHYTDAQGKVHNEESIGGRSLSGNQYQEVYAQLPKGISGLINSHVHDKGKNQFSTADKAYIRANDPNGMTFKNNDRHRAHADLWYKGWQYLVDRSSERIIQTPYMNP